MKEKERMKKNKWMNEFFNDTPAQKIFKLLAIKQECVWKYATYLKMKFEKVVSLMSKGGGRVRVRGFSV